MISDRIFVGRTVLIEFDCWVVVGGIGFVTDDYVRAYGYNNNKRISVVSV